MQKFGANPIVEPDAARNLLDIGANLLAQISNLVDEGDLGGKKGVGRIFDQFGGPAPSVDDRRLIEVKGTVDFRHHLFRALVVSANDDPIRVLEITNRGALAQEFRL